MISTKVGILKEYELEVLPIFKRREK